MYERKNFRTVLIVYPLIGAIALLSCTPADSFEPTEANSSVRARNATEDTSGPPPLVVDTSEPLLLDDPAEENVVSTEAAAENAACFVCHADYMDEFLAEQHAKANIGCVNCHGDSFAHRNDENNTTPPEVMYAADKIDPFCRGCHEAHDIAPKKIIAAWMKQKVKKPGVTCEGCHKQDDVPPAKVVARWKELDIDKGDPAKIVCTDCHGQHRMKVRTVIWDKETGKLVHTNQGD